MRSNNKKIAFPPLAGSAIGVIGDNLSRQAIQIEGGIPPCYLNKGAGKVRFSVVSTSTSLSANGERSRTIRKVLYTFLHHKICLCMGLLFVFIPVICPAQNQNLPPIESTGTPKEKAALFQGEINTNNINIRSDSTVISKVICVSSKGEPVEVVKESYEWYKIRLPKTAPSFIKKNLVSLIDEKTAKVIKDNVNIRLAPDETSPILSKADKNEVINILSESPQWYKIEPLNNSFGWIHKKFVDKAETINRKEKIKLSREIKKENKITVEETTAEESVTIEGIIKPYGKVIKRVATHKLLAEDNKVFLLKGNKESLDSLNYHKVRITGKPIHPKHQKVTIIEIVKIEALD